MNPLCIDLDGTLTRRDTLSISALELLRTRPWMAALLPFWLLRGRAFVKRELARRAPVRPERLPYNTELLAMLRDERARGRSLWLVTAADRAIAEAVAAHLGLFDGVLASDGARNLKAGEKLRALQERFPQGFDYAGNSAADLPVWTGARAAIVVNAPRRVLRKAERTARVARVIA